MRWHQHRELRLRLREARSTLVLAFPIMADRVDQMPRRRRLCPVREPPPNRLAPRWSPGSCRSPNARPVAFNVDASWLASAGADHRIRLWHIGTGQPLGPELRVNFVPQTITFDRARQALVATGANGERQVYDLSMVTTRADDLALRAEALSARRFDPSEVLVMLGSREAGERLAHAQKIPGLSPAPTRAQMLRWHASRATLAATWRGEAPSARFHRRQIERIEAGGEIWVGQGPAGALQPAINREVPADDALDGSPAPPSAGDSSPKRNPTR